MEQFNLGDNVDTLFHSLENFTQKEGVIGKAVTMGEKTLLPVVSVSIGYGGGNASMGKGQSGSTTTTAMGSGNSGTEALGLGAKLTTDAIIIIDNQNVSMLPMSATGASQLVDKIPQIVSSMSQNKQAGQTQQGQ
jgi:uncharacterized spore protein YtfJ